MDRIEQLARLIADATDGDGSRETALAGVHLTRWSTPRVPRTTVSCAVLCVVAQGAKAIHVNAERTRYARGSYLLVSMDLPLVGEVVEASRGAPYLGLTLELDLGEIRALELDLPADESAAAAPRAVGVHALDDDLLDAAVRLVRLTRTPADARVLAPLVRRELYYRLLRGPQGGLLRRVAAEGGPAGRVGAGLAWLRRNAARPVRMADLAREMHMSPSTMHAWFKGVTGLTPLQYQKRLRLQEARRLLVGGAVDAATASRRVGYESASQFSREYRRLFGAPPMRDVERLRWAAGASAE